MVSAIAKCRFRIADSDFRMEEKRAIRHQLSAVGERIKSLSCGVREAQGGATRRPAAGVG